MKWGHVSDLIKSQFEGLPTVGYGIFPSSRTRAEFEEMLRCEYEAISKETLDALEYFIRTGHWPEMSDKVSFFMKPRLLFAWRVTASLSKPLLGEPLPTFSASLEHHLIWALVDIWSAVGFDCFLIEEGNRLSAMIIGLEADRE